MSRALLRVVGEGSGSPLVVAGLRQLGGAFAVPDPAGGALSHLTARYAYSGSGVPLGDLTTADILAHCATIRAALTPWDAGGLEGSSTPGDSSRRGCGSRALVL